MTTTRIDTHAHHIPDFYAADLTAHGYHGLLPDWSPEAAVAFMDEHDIATQLVSITEPGVGYLDQLSERVAMAAWINDWTAETLLGSPRFGGFAVLPLGDPGPAEVEAACAEAVRAVTELGFDGVGLLSSYAGVYLGDPVLDPLMDTLQQLGVVTFVHPATPVNAPQVGEPALPPLLMEFTFDTTRAAVNMSYRQVYTRFPGIRWLLAHAGGTLPYLAFRATLVSLQLPVPEENFDYSRLYYDTALAWAPETLACTEGVAGADHIVYGTDWPYSGVVFDKLGDQVPAPAHRDNALALFPRLTEGDRT